MIVKVEDILAAILEKYLSEAKKLFAALRDAYVDRINTVLVVLKDLLDKKADENTLRQARVLLKQANYVRFVPGTETVLGKASVQFVKTLISSIAEDAAKKKSAPMSNEEIFAEYEFTAKAQAAFLKGVTIGELFVIQPDLFL